MSASGRKQPFEFLVFPKLNDRFGEKQTFEIGPSLCRLVFLSWTENRRRTHVRPSGCYLPNWSSLE